MKATIRKAIVFLLVLAMSSIVAFGYSDVDANSQLGKNVDALSKAGFVNGYDDGTFQPQGNITRAELVKMLNQVMGYEGSLVSNTFTDVKETHWFYNEVKTALQRGYILGYEDGTFRPNNKISRQEVAVILDRIEKLDGRVSESAISGVKVSGMTSWAADAVKRCLAAELMTTDANGNFNGSAFATRAEIANACIAILKYDGRVTTDGDGNITIVAQTTTTGASITTPPAVSGGGGGGSTGGSGGGNTSGPATGTIKTALERLTKQLGPLLNNSDYTDTEKKIIKMVKDSLESYNKDTSFDVDSAVKESKEVYKGMTSTEQETFKNKMQNAGLDVQCIDDLEKHFGFDLF